MRLVLASASSRRAELLGAAGFTFDTLVVDIDERPQPGEPAEHYVRRLAAEKSAAGLSLLHSPDDETVMLGADTAVVIDGQILGKPEDDNHVADTLRRLSGRCHQVITGVSLRSREREVGAVEVTTVEFAPLRDEDVAWYVLSKEGRDKAGAYAIQGLAARFIPRIEGSYSNVVGLPISLVHRLLVEIASDPRSGYAGR